MCSKQVVKLKYACKKRWLPPVTPQRIQCNRFSHTYINPKAHHKLEQKRCWIKVYMSKILMLLCS